MLDGIEIVAIALAAAAAGAVNALAGGGTLITFPVLTAVGLPAVTANVTNTVALLPGYVGGTLAQRSDLRGQRRRAWLFVPAGLVGGLLGAVLLLATGERVFRTLVPFLILGASALLAVQEPLRARLVRRAERLGHGPESPRWGVPLVGIAAVYGGYFGAGLSVILLAVLGLAVDDSLTRLNALKQMISLAANVAAATFFVFSGRVEWWAALVMALAALVGGAIGGRLASRVRPATLRRIVVAIGTVVGVVYLARW